jgi:hypothetical protein
MTNSSSSMLNSVNLDLPLSGKELRCSARGLGRSVVHLPYVVEIVTVDLQNAQQLYPYRFSNPVITKRAWLPQQLPLDRFRRRILQTFSRSDIRLVQVLLHIHAYFLPSCPSLDLLMSRLCTESTACSAPALTSGGSNCCEGSEDKLSAGPLSRLELCPENASGSSCVAAARHDAGLSCACSGIIVFLSLPKFSQVAGNDRISHRVGGTRFRVRGAAAERHVAHSSRGRRF